MHSKRKKGKFRSVPTDAVHQDLYVVQAWLTEGRPWTPLSGNTANQCSITARSTGLRCRRNALLGLDVCNLHNNITVVGPHHRDRHAGLLNDLGAKVGVFLDDWS